MKIVEYGYRFLEGNVAEPNLSMDEMSNILLDWKDKLKYRDLYLFKHSEVLGYFELEKNEVYFSTKLQGDRFRWKYEPQQTLQDVINDYNLTAKDYEVK